MPARRRAYSRRRAPVRRRRAYVRRRPRYASNRRSVSRAGRGASRCVCPGDMSDGTKFALAQLDPFDPTVAGAKVPDSNVQPSISTTDIEQVSLITSINPVSNNGIAFRPSYTWGHVNATPGVPVDWGAAYAANAVNRSKRSGYLLAIELTRPVAHAVRLSSPVAPTSASGFVHIGISTETNYAQSTWQYPRTVAEISGCQFYKRVTLASLTQSPLTVINKWIDDTGFRYSSPQGNLDVATGTQFQTDYGWGAIVILLEGAPVGINVLSAEHLLISEGIPQKDGPILGTPAAVSSAPLMDVVSEVVADQPHAHTEAEQDTFLNRGVNAMAAGARRQGEVAFQTIGIPLLQHAGGQAMSMAQAGFMAALGIGGVNNNPNRLATSIIT